MSDASAQSVQSVLAKVITYLEDNLDEKPDKPIEASSELVRDVRLDSIQSFEMIADLEDHYDIRLPTELFADVVTVEDVAKRIHGVVSGGAGADA